MTVRPAETSPQTLARIGGVLYLIIIIAGGWAEAFVRGELVVSGDAAATAHNIMASPLLWRASITGEIIMHACDVALSLVFYLLLRPVSKRLALLAVFWDLTGVTVMVTNKLNLFAASFLLGDAGYLKAFEPRQLQALAYLSIKAHSYGYGIGLVFFALDCLVLGYLIFRSGYFPKTLGILMQVAGLCYVTNSFAMFLAPALQDALFPVIMIPAFIGELSLCLWLLVKGVNVQKWEAVRD